MRVLHACAMTAVVFGYDAPAQVMTSDTHFELRLDEVRPVLDVISRLAPLKVATEPNVMAGSVRVCFEDDQALTGLNATLVRFKGNAAWLLISHLPLVCLVAVPEESMLREHGVGTESELRERILRDVPALAKFLEDECGLRSKPSKGIRVLPRSAETVIVHGPGGPTFLVADPKRFLLNDFLFTSARDQTLEFWMSDRELDDLYDALHPAQSSVRATGEVDLLRRISETTYENLIVMPEEVARLRRQCENMSRVPSSLKDAMLRIIAICDLAAPHHLGIVVLGG